MLSILKGVAAITLIAGTWWSMAEATRSSDVIYAGLNAAFSTPPVQPESIGGFGLVEDGASSDCCDDFTNAFGLAFILTLLSGMPMAALAFFLRRSLIAFRPAAEPFLIAAFVLQFASIAIASLLTVLFFVVVSTEGPIGEGWPILVFLLPTIVVGTVGLRFWYQMRRDIQQVSTTASYLSYTA